jgi:hypothetical protein
MATTNLSQKNAFLQYLQNSDIDRLEEILDDSITYFGASKKTFLKKLAFIFEHVKTARIKISITIKKHKIKDNLYYFKLNQYSYKFLLEEKQGRITKLDNTKTRYSKEYIENANVYDLFFGEDERVDFMPAREYSNTLSRCNKAYAEIVNDSTQILSKQDLINWLETHSSLFEEVKDQYSLFGFKPFKDLYNDFKLKIEHLAYYDLIKLELKAYNRAFRHEWKANYNREIDWYVSMFNIDFIEVNLTNKTCKSFRYPNVYFHGEDFLTIVKYNELVKECDCGCTDKKDYIIIP